ncbi:hypothetical protein [Lysinibacillus sp. 54212]|uniref:hypothetical protein n=1 Tax=Lysinibacillus sp. 54212 TaxID=3119829 RepID=UPI002FCB7C3A
MKQFAALSTIALLFFMLTGCNSMEEQKAEKAINTYYNALIEKDYKRAFSTLFPFDDTNALSNGTQLTKKEAEKLFIEQMDTMDKQNYKITCFKILEVEYEDGHSFWHHVEVTGEHNGESFSHNEVVDTHDGKLVIRSSDPYVEFRNGNMNIGLISM